MFMNIDPVQSVYILMFTEHIHVFDVNLYYMYYGISIPAIIAVFIQSDAARVWLHFDFILHYVILSTDISIPSHGYNIRSF